MKIQSELFLLILCCLNREQTVRGGYHGSFYPITTDTTETSETLQTEISWNSNTDNKDTQYERNANAGITSNVPRITNKIHYASFGTENRNNSTKNIDKLNKRIRRRESDYHVENERNTEHTTPKINNIRDILVDKGPSNNTELLKNRNFQFAFAHSTNNDSQGGAFTEVKVVTSNNNTKVTNITAKDIFKDNINNEGGFPLGFLGNGMKNVLSTVMRSLISNRMQIDNKDSVSEDIIKRFLGDNNTNFADQLIKKAEISIEPSRNYRSSKDKHDTVSPSISVKIRLEPYIESDTEIKTASELLQAPDLRFKKSENVEKSEKLTSERRYDSVDNIKEENKNPNILQKLFQSNFSHLDPSHARNMEKTVNAENDTIFNEIIKQAKVEALREFLKNCQKSIEVTEEINTKSQEFENSNNPSVVKSLIQVTHRKNQSRLLDETSLNKCSFQELERIFNKILHSLSRMNNVRNMNQTIRLIIKRKVYASLLDNLDSDDLERFSESFLIATPNADTETSESDQEPSERIVIEIDEIDDPDYRNPHNKNTKVARASQQIIKDRCDDDVIKKPPDLFRALTTTIVPLIYNRIQKGQVAENERLNFEITTEPNSLVESENRIGSFSKTTIIPILRKVRIAPQKRASSFWSPIVGILDYALKLARDILQAIGVRIDALRVMLGGKKDSLDFRIEDLLSAADSPVEDRLMDDVNDKIVSIEDCSVKKRANLEDNSATEDDVARMSILNRIPKFQSSINDLTERVSHALRMLNRNENVDNNEKCTNESDEAIGHRLDLLSKNTTRIRRDVDSYNDLAEYGLRNLNVEEEDDTLLSPVSRGLGSLGGLLSLIGTVSTFIKFVLGLSGNFKPIIIFAGVAVVLALVAVVSSVIMYLIINLARSVGLLSKDLWTFASSADPSTQSSTEYEYSTYTPIYESPYLIKTFNFNVFKDIFGFFTNLLSKIFRF